MQREGPLAAFSAVNFPELGTLTFIEDGNFLQIRVRYPQHILRRYKTGVDGDDLAGRSVYLLGQMLQQ
jgi:hypothetical protein